MRVGTIVDDEEAAPIVAVKKVVPVVAAAAVKKVIPGQATRAPARKVFQADAEINADTPAANGEVRDDRGALFPLAASAPPPPFVVAEKQALFFLPPWIFFYLLYDGMVRRMSDEWRRGKKCD